MKNKNQNRCSHKDIWGHIISARWIVLLITIPVFSPLTETGAQTYSGGMLDDGLIHTPTNYGTFVPPAKGQTYVDPVFGSTIKRLSQGHSEFNDAVHHEYSVPNAFNANDTRVLLVGENVKGFFVVDMNGNFIIDVPARGTCEPHWDKFNPNLIYYHGYQDPTIYRFDIISGNSTVEKNFPQFSEINFGKGENDVSPDGDHLIVNGDNSIVGVYTFSTQTLGPTYNYSNVAVQYDCFDLTASNMVTGRGGSADHYEL